MELVALLIEAGPLGMLALAVAFTTGAFLVLAPALSAIVRKHWLQVPKRGNGEMHSAGLIGRHEGIFIALREGIGTLDKELGRMAEQVKGIEARGVRNESKIRALELLLAELRGYMQRTEQATRALVSSWPPAQERLAELENEREK